MALWSTYGLGWPGTEAWATATSNVAMRELLMEGITNISPQKTPVFSMLPKEELSQVVYSWVTDALAATGTAGSAEGAEFSDATLTSRVRYTNNVCWFRKDFKVSFTAVDVSKRGNVAGVRNEYEYQLGKAMLEVRRNIDARIVALGTTVSALTGELGTATRTAVIRAFPCVATDVAGAFATDDYMALREALDDEGAEPDTVFCSTGVKLAISNVFKPMPGGTNATNVLQRYAEGDKRFSSVVNILEDDLGEVFIVRDRFIPSAAATAAASTATNAAAYFLCERSKIVVGFLNGIRHIPLPPNGTAHRGIVEAVWGMKVKHPSCVGIAWNVTN